MAFMGLNKKKPFAGVRTTSSEEAPKQIGLQVRFPGCADFVPLGRSQYNKIHSDDLGPRLLVLIDEVAELLEPSGIATPQGKEEDAMKNEIHNIIKSITQLGRSAGIHCLLATQRNDARIISGQIQNNPLALDTKLRVLRPDDFNEDGFLDLVKVGAVRKKEYV